MSACRPGPANSRNATRPSVLAPTSMTARSFSIPTTLPFTTEPSCGLPWVKDSSSIFAKSSRDGAADGLAVAMNAPGSDWSVGVTFRARPTGACRTVPRTLGNHQGDKVRPDGRALETMIAIRHTITETVGAGSSSDDGSAVSRAPVLLGRLRQCRWRPGTRRLYPNAWYRASARLAR